jgi:hypothetical protein
MSTDVGGESPPEVSRSSLEAEGGSQKNQEECEPSDGELDSGLMQFASAP